MTNSKNSYTNQQVITTEERTAGTASSLFHATKSSKNSRLDLKARVGRHHFALLRGYLEGIDLRLLAQRYLHAEGAEAADLRIIKRILRWTIDELIVLARRHGEFAFARAIDIEPSRIQASDDAQLPSLDDFRAERDPDGFYGEVELLELFRDEYPNGGGSNRKEKRNARLRERQYEALRWLETLVAADPQMDDALAGWFPEALATRLNAVGIITLAELVAWINQRGTRWYVAIPKIGQEAAQRILTWLEMNRGSLKYTFGKQVFTKRSELKAEDLPEPLPCEGIVPLEYFKPRPELDGSIGTNRANNSNGVASTDVSAVQLWLDSCAKIGGSTWLSYRREAERFLAWCVIEQCKPLSSVNDADCLAYRQFLDDLGRITREVWKSKYQTDIAQWIGRRGTSRMSEAWRPFDGGRIYTSSLSPIATRTIATTAKHGDTHAGVLSPSSQRQAIVILKNLFSYLVKIRYLDLNPFGAIEPTTKRAAKNLVDRSFSAADWDAILSVLESLPKNDHYHRLRFLLKFTHETGLRLSELVAAKYGDLGRHEASLDKARQEKWILRVPGKRAEPRIIPLSISVLEELHSYMANRGYANPAEIPATTYLLGRLVSLPDSLNSALGQRGIRLEIDQLSARNLHQVLKNFFSYAYEQMQATAPESAARIRKASAHWLR